MSDTTQAPFTARDGLNLALYDWPLPSRVRPRGVVLIVHGLGEHAWRYNDLAHRLNEWGFFVRAYDQRGHGDSGGAPGVLPDDDALLDDLQEMVDDTRRHIAEPWSCPLILLGHSMGGLVSATFVQRGMARVDALVLSSPALDAGLSGFKRWLIGLMMRLSPDTTLGNGLDAEKISHDPAVVKAYQRDRRVHDRISARLARFIDDNGPRVRAAAPRWPVPTLLMFAGDDHLVNPAGSVAFANAAPAPMVVARRFDGLYHEIFNERDNAAVFDTLRQWLDRLAPARG
ncbi:MAG: alpha/beta hydrolase [Comamonadaceae bacterium]|jgi:alpha-beta hydrolase superfamily lysophospholipase|uniref:Lysophospholipase n=1 Tax=Hydrogenophaga borbori TaxID=2294117 RepID=A0A372EDK0_9BURK|nr:MULTISPECIES: alpha/beta hydrolase [Hydrogenophaga]NCT99886.1 alpha/beta hydrolase [Comamonadaceae bacterium]RFP75498.1 lysophospholipase [Hydrogenophaga borbori]WQB83708.1 alpha/beta hydrolase [Hydrogenophaga sp. SNF1]